LSWLLILIENNPNLLLNIQVILNNGTSQKFALAILCHLNISSSWYFLNMPVVTKRLRLEAGLHNIQVIQSKMWLDLCRGTITLNFTLKMGQNWL
jgi:hypothetical protein